MATEAQAMLLEHLRQSMLYHEDGGITDGALLECFIGQRDEAAFAALVRRHGPMVLGVCRRVLHNEADVEDCFQATFLVLVRKAASIRPRGMVGNWLYKVAHNAALKAKAMRNQRQTKEREAAELKVRQPAEQEPELQELLDQELHALPDKYRAAIVLCDLEGKTMLAASRELGCPQGTLKRPAGQRPGHASPKAHPPGADLGGRSGCSCVGSERGIGRRATATTNLHGQSREFVRNRAGGCRRHQCQGRRFNGRSAESNVDDKAQARLRGGNDAKPCRCRRGSCLLRDIGNRANGRGEPGHGPENGCGGFVQQQPTAKADAKDDEKEGGADSKVAAGAPIAKTEPPKPLPENIVTAWKEAGAEVGWLRLDVYGHLELVPEKEGKPGDLPAFRFTSRREGILAKLPAPAPAFGLSLRYTELTDAGLKELAGLKSLQTLDLYHTQVTDVGLKELAGLKSLQALDLGETKVTDGGVHELQQALPGCRITRSKHLDPADIPPPPLLSPRK